MQDENDYLGRCLHCRREITAQGGVACARRPEALPALRDDRLVTGAGLLTGYIAPRYSINYLLPVRWSVA